MTRRQSGAGDLLDRLNADRSLQTEICATLEILADSLPGPIDRKLAERLRSIMETGWAEHVGFQESVVFPILQRYHAGLPLITYQIDELQSEHASVAGSTHELSEQLDLLRRGTQLNVNMFGYMLRCTFKELRKHLDCEQRFFAAAVPNALAPVDRELFDHWLSTHAWPVQFTREPIKK